MSFPSRLYDAADTGPRAVASSAGGESVWPSLSPCSKSARSERPRSLGSEYEAEPRIDRQRGAGHAIEQACLRLARLRPRLARCVTAYAVTPAITTSSDTADAYHGE